MMPTGPYQDWSVNKQRQPAGGITSASMSSLNALAPQLNQLQSGMITTICLFLEKKNTFEVKIDLKSKMILGKRLLSKIENHLNCHERTAKPRIFRY